MIFTLMQNDPGKRPSADEIARALGQEMAKRNPFSKRLNGSLQPANLLRLER